MKEPQNVEEQCSHKVLNIGGLPKRGNFIATRYMYLFVYPSPIHSILGKGYTMRIQLATQASSGPFAAS